MSESRSTLSGFIRDSRERLLADWRETARRDSSFSPPSRLSYREFLDGIPDLLEELCEFLEAPDSAGVDMPGLDKVRGHARTRWKQRFDLEELIRDWGALQRVVLEAASRFFDEVPQAGEVRSEMLRRTCYFFTEGMASNVEHLDELRRGEASEKVRELERLQSAIGKISEARSHFLSGVSHDISGALTAISGASDLLKSEPVVGDESVRSSLGEIIEDSVGSAGKVLEVMLQVARLDAGQVVLEKESTRLAGFLEECIQGIATYRCGDVSVGNELPADFESDVDRGKLRRTVEVLFGFAEANHVEGPVRLTCAAEDDCWTLGFRFAAGSTGERTGDLVDDRRSEINRLLLERLCLIQKASFTIESDGVDGEVSVFLRFPVAADDKERV